MIVKAGAIYQFMDRALQTFQSTNPGEFTSLLSPQTLALTVCFTLHKYDCPNEEMEGLRDEVYTEIRLLDGLYL